MHEDEKRRRATESRVRHAYRKAALMGKLGSVSRAARDLLGPDVAYHLYRTHHPVGPDAAGGMAIRYILLDRDGTLIEDRNYLADPEGVHLLPGVAEALHRLRAAGFGLVLVTNQSGVGRGFFSLEEVERVHARLRDLLAAADVRLDGIYVCPHAPEEGCDCRKPSRGLALQAARELGFRPEDGFVIGDKLSDVDFARRLGAVPILVRTGQGGAVGPSEVPEGAHVADDLAAAAAWILSLPRHEPS